jgi:hypothetical protein
VGKSGPRLSLVEPTPHKRTAGKPLECECGSRTTIEVRIDRHLKDGKVTAGHKQLKCYHCGRTVWG